MSTYTLSGSGTQALTAATTALHVTISTLTPGAGSGSANPTNHYGAGFLRAGDSTGFWEPFAIEGGPQWIGLPNGTTQLGYNVLGSGVITVTEVIGGVSPFVGPVGPSGPAGSAGGPGDYLSYEDQKTAGTSGGTFTSGSWQTRTLNTEVSDSGNHGSVASNQVTLDDGTYIVRASAPGFQIGVHQTRLQNITATATLLTGTCEYCDPINSVSNRSFIDGKIVLAVRSVIELQHRSQSTKAATGAGVSLGVTTEVYAKLVLEKVA